MRAITILTTILALAPSLAFASPIPSTNAVAPRASDSTVSDLAINVDTITKKVDGHDVVLGSQISADSHSKSTVYHVASYGGKANPGYVIKIYNGSANLNQQEVDALRDVGQLIASDAHEKAVVMLEAKGQTLAKLVESQPKAQQQAYTATWVPKVAAVVANIAKNKGILHEDLNLDNIMIDGSNIQLIDWEHTARRGARFSDFTDDVSKIENRLKTAWSDKLPSSSPHY